MSLFGKFANPLFVLLTLFSCVDIIELPKPDIPELGMLVQGKLLYGNPSAVTVDVFELYTLSSNVPRPIGGAQVVLEDDMGHSIGIGNQSAGTYFRALSPDNPDFPIASGRQYRVVVSLPNGKQYQSSWETLLPAPKPDSLSVTFAVKEYLDQRGETRLDSFAEFSISTELIAPQASTRSNIRWEIDQGYKLTDDPGKTCYVVRKLLADNVLALNGPTAGQDRLTNYTLAEMRVDYRFAEGFYLLAYQQAITENAYGYFDELHQLLSKKGTLFDPPVGAIRSNIVSVGNPEELTYGFFYVAQQDTLRLYVSPETASFPKVYCPLPPTNGEAANPNACDDCLLDLGAGLARPAWWEF